LSRDTRLAPKLLAILGEKLGIGDRGNIGLLERALRLGVCLRSLEDGD